MCVEWVVGGGGVMVRCVGVRGEGEGGGWKEVVRHHTPGEEEGGREGREGGRGGEGGGGGGEGGRGGREERGRGGGSE